jgi:D-isomer specific 2-hydroxyacid dehydrogenase, catalytic domain
VLVARHLPRVGLERLAESCEIREAGLDSTRERLLELAPGADAIVADPSVRVDAELLDAAGPQVRLVANFAVGYDNVDLEACRSRGVRVSNTREAPSGSPRPAGPTMTTPRERRREVARRPHQRNCGAGLGTHPGRGATDERCRSGPSSRPLDRV